MKKIINYVLYTILALLIASFFILYCLQSHSIIHDAVLAAVIMTLVLFATGLVMEYLAVLIFLAVMALIKAAPPATIFSGFTSSAFWLVFAGIAIGIAIKKSGLVERISQGLHFFCRGSYLSLIIGLVVLGVFMSFIMPSTLGRVMIILPILIEFAKQNGFEKGSKGYNGILLAGIVGTNISGYTILPANLPNIVLMGSLKSIYHLELEYAQYFLLHFPILGAFKLIILIATVYYSFNDQPKLLSSNKSVTHVTDLSTKEKCMIFYLIAMITAWFLGSTTHLSPAWPALIMAVICLLPGIGVIDHKLFLREANLEPLFYVGGLIGLSAMVNYSGIGAWLGQELFTVLPFLPGHDTSNFFLLTLTSTLIGTVTTLPGIPAILTPLAQHMADMTHLPLLTIIMTQVAGFSIFILPYQVPAILVTMRLGGIPLKDVTKLCLILACASIFLLLPLDYLWWRVLGVI